MKNVSARPFAGRMLSVSYRAVCGAILFASMPIVGCGTVTNLVNQRPENGGVTPFGGVRQDVSGMRQAANGEFGLRAPCRPEEQHPQVIPLVLCAADLPLSFVGDVVTWPYAAAYTFINQPTPAPPVTQATVVDRPAPAPSVLLPAPKAMP